MMVLIYASLFLASIFGYFQKNYISYFFLLVTIFCVTKLFLFEVHDKVYGYGLPWLNL